MFVQLSLAFRNDSYTLESRINQAERERNLTEENTEKELENFKASITVIEEQLPLRAGPTSPTSKVVSGNEKGSKVLAESSSKDREGLRQRSWDQAPWQILRRAMVGSDMTSFRPARCSVSPLGFSCIWKTPWPGLVS